MPDPISSATSVSLLARIGQNDRDPTAWREFVDRYGRRIYEWCLNRKLQPADAEDVTQEVLVKLAKRLGAFEYDEKLTFRGWLRRITENAVTDYFRQLRSAEGRQRHVDDGLAALEEAEARADLAERLSDAYDMELLDLAKANVRGRVETRRWLAWEWMAVEQRNGEEVAEELEMKLPTVYSSRYQVQKMIADEVRRLESQSDAVVIELSQDVSK